MYGSAATSAPAALLTREEPARYRARPAGHDGAALKASPAPPGGEGARLDAEPTPSTPPGGAVDEGGGAADASAGGEGCAIVDAPVSLEEALAQVDAAVAVLAEVDLRAQPDEAVEAAAIGLPQRLAKLQARVVDAVGEVDRRQCHQQHGAATAAAWWRSRIGCDPGHAQQTVTASRRLRHLPALADAFADGEVSWDHTRAITQAAVPQRMEAIQVFDETLVELARWAPPRDVRVVLARIRDVEDVDGSEAGPLPDAGPDPRRALTVHRTVDGLGEVRGPLDPVTTEWLTTLIEAFETPDSPDTPQQQRRTAAQRRHDALHTLLTKVAAHPDTPTLQGARPHVVVMVDVATLAGVDTEAIRTPTMRDTGPITSALARQLATDARVTAVQTMGPWRAVNVGDSHRTLPAWLREIMHMVQPTCCGIDCDRPATWTDAHHLDAWADHRETDLNRTVPACDFHHGLLTDGGWTVDFDLDRGVYTWTSPTGRAIQTRPRPP